MSEISQDIRAGGHPAISQRSDVSVAHVTARKGQRIALSDLVQAKFGIAPPNTPRAVEAAGLLIVWAGPDQWLFLGQPVPGIDLSIQLGALFSGLASVVDVSDSRTIFKVAAQRPSDALKTSMGIDFADTSFRPGDVAITQVAHLGVMAWRIPDGSGYEFACARTYSRDFLDWLGKV